MENGLAVFARLWYVKKKKHTERNFPLRRFLSGVLVIWKGTFYASLPSSFWQSSRKRSSLAL